MRLLKWIGYLLFGLVVAVAALFGAARFHDGPLAVIPGGALESGAFVTDAVIDWAFARDVATIEMQLEGDETSRTVWIVVDGSNAYIPCGLGFPPLKNWHRKALVDGRAILRIDGRRYRVTMTRIEDAALLARVGDETRRKYETPPRAGEVWFFSIEVRAA